MVLNAISKDVIEEATRCKCEDRFCPAKHYGENDLGSRYFEQEASDND